MSQRALLIFRESAVPYPGDYVWRAAVNSVVDGDTAWVERDTGCRHSDLIELRITGQGWKGFNADERFTPGGKVVTAEVKRLCPEGSVVRIETKPDTEKYGRWLSPILIPVITPVDAFDGQTIVEIRESPLSAARYYVDLASHLVRTFPEAARWQAYS